MEAHTNFYNDVLKGKSKRKASNQQITRKNKLQNAVRTKFRRSIRTMKSKLKRIIFLKFFQI
jgi:hypothetical protein